MAEQPHVGKLHPGPVLGVVLYALLAISLAVALLGERAPLLPAPWAAAAPIAFALFLVLFAIYRFALIRAGRYPFGRALFQVGAGLLFLAVLLHRNPPVVSVRADALPQLLASPDALVRRLGCELGRYRPDGAASLPLLREHASRDLPSVRAECEKTVQALGARH